MKSKNLLLGSSLLLMACSQNPKPDKKMDHTSETVNKLKAPLAQKIDTLIQEHNNQRLDHYFWMRLSDEQKEADNPDEQTQKVMAYLEAENAYTKAWFSNKEDLKNELFKEIVGRIKEDDESVPYWDNGYYYYDRVEKGKEYEIVCRKKDSLANEEEILIDANNEASGLDFYDLGSVEISPNTQLMAWSYDDVSRRQYHIKIKDLNSGKILSDNIENTSGDIVWAADNEHFFYITKDPQTLRECKVYRHKLGTPQSEDVMVYFEKDEAFYLEISDSKSSEYILIESFSTMASEARYIKANQPLSEFVVFSPREEDHLYSIEHHENRWFILSNQNALNFQVFECNLARTTSSDWKIIIPHRKEVRIEDIEVYKEHLVLRERENGLQKLRIKNLLTNQDTYVPFDEETYTVSISENLDFNSEWLRYHYSSLKVPSSVIEYNLKNGKSVTRKTQEIIGGYDPKAFETKRVWAMAPDGVKIPISLVYRKGIKMDGNNPLLLYGYGSYGVTIPDRFSIPRLSLLDRGFVFAIAHIRGSEYLGRDWYESGKKLKKINTFTDFIACGEFLIQEGYTSNEKLYAMGGSAGGLLMGAVINMKPEIFHGVVAQVPFVDVMSTMWDESIPLTTGEFDEWGNPKNKEYYDYMLQYSPYDNVKKQAYPNMLVTTGYWDSQVQYWEPAKWVAKLREYKTDKNILLLETNLSTGHGGASGRYESYKETAMEYAFLISLARS